MTGRAGARRFVAQVVERRHGAESARAGQHQRRPSDEERRLAHVAWIDAHGDLFLMGHNRGKELRPGTGWTEGLAGRVSSRTALSLFRPVRRISMEIRPMIASSFSDNEVYCLAE